MTTNSEQPTESQHETAGEILASIRELRRLCRERDEEHKRRQEEIDRRFEQERERREQERSRRQEERRRLEEERERRHEKRKRRQEEERKSRQEGIERRLEVENRERRQALEESRRETNRRLREMDRRNKEIQRYQKETARQMRETDRLARKSHRDFVTKWGQLLESLVEGDLVPVLKDRGIVVERTYQRGTDGRRGEHFEVDIVATNGDEVVVVEVKTTLRPKHVKHFLAKLKVFQDWAPEYRTHRVYGAVAYLKANSSSERMAERQGLFAIRATGGSASIVNANSFKPRAFYWKRPSVR